MESVLLDASRKAGLSATALDFRPPLLLGVRNVSETLPRSHGEPDPRLK
jgi:hypothetical protein